MLSSKGEVEEILWEIRVQQGLRRPDSRLRRIYTEVVNFLVKRFGSASHMHI